MLCHFRGISSSERSAKAKIFNGRICLSHGRILIAEGDWACVDLDDPYGFEGRDDVGGALLDGLLVGGQAEFGGLRGFEGGLVA